MSYRLCYTNGEGQALRRVAVYRDTRAPVGGHEYVVVSPVNTTWWLEMSGDHGCDAQFRRECEALGVPSAIVPAPKPTRWKARVS